MKKTIAILEKEVALEQEKVNVLAGRIESKDKKIEDQNSVISAQGQKIFALEQTNARTLGRFQEILAAHDILLRSSLRASGMAWEDIERIITESRRPFMTHDDEISHHDRADFGPGSVMRRNLGL